MMATEAMVRAIEKPEDPDAQHTVTDFLDYTEYLPSDLTRSLTLIGKLDESYLARAGTVHDLLKQYAFTPNGALCNKLQSQSLPHEVSYNLDHAIRDRESAYGEAARLYEMVDRHYNRLTSIKTKLNALPKPPSRDPTPIPRSPQASRATTRPRITLKLDGAKQSALAGKVPEKNVRPRHHSRRITIPGEVLPPANPDSPLPFTDSDWESIPPSPLPMPTSRVGGSRKSHKNGRIKLPKPLKQHRERVPRPPRAPGMGTNVHSSVAGISTSNALSLLPAPPPDAKPGSEYMPWMRLTEYEMAKLRKRMKKNAIWTPSETMIRRELADAGRGPDNYKIRKAQAEEQGEEFLDVDNIATTAPGKPLVPGEISADSLGLAETSLSNRGMKLNEAKKLKRDAMIAASLAGIEKTPSLESATGFKTLFTKPLENPVVMPGPISISNNVPKNRSHKKKIAPIEEAMDNTKFSLKKRKREEAPKKEPVSSTIQQEATVVALTKRPSPKKQKTTQAHPQSLRLTTRTVTTSVPLAAPAPSPVKPSRRSKSATPATPVLMAAPEKPRPSTAMPRGIATATSSRPRRISLTLKGPAEPLDSPTQPSPRTSSRAASRRASTGPPSATTPRTPRESVRRKSATPAPPPSPFIPHTAAARRSRRPAPGAVIENKEGGAAISVGRRQHAPKRGSITISSTRKGTESAITKDKEAFGKLEHDSAGDTVDPNEPRYCLCDDVSYGEMICCDNQNVSKIIEKLLASRTDSIHAVRKRLVPFWMREPDREPTAEDEMVLPNLCSKIQKIVTYIDPAVCYMVK